jgi:hypothetical protein
MKTQMVAAALVLALAGSAMAEDPKPAQTPTKQTEKQSSPIIPAFLTEDQLRMALDLLESQRRLQAMMQVIGAEGKQVLIIATETTQAGPNQQATNRIIGNGPVPMTDSVARQTVQVLLNDAKAKLEKLGVKSEAATGGSTSTNLPQ